MKWTKSLILASLFLSVNAFSYNDYIWKDTRALHNSAWQVVQLIEGSNKLSHLTNSIRDFANRTGDLKYSIRTNAAPGKIQRDIARMEQTFGYLMSRLRTVNSTMQYKKIHTKVELMKSRYFKIHSYLVSNYNLRGGYYAPNYRNNNYNYGRRYYNDRYYNSYNNGYYNGNQKYRPRIYYR